LGSVLTEALSKQSSRRTVDRATFLKRQAGFSIDRRRLQRCYLLARPVQIKTPRTRRGGLQKVTLFAFSVTLALRQNPPADATRRACNGNEDLPPAALENAEHRRANSDNCTGFLIEHLPAPAHTIAGNRRWSSLRVRNNGSPKQNRVLADWPIDRLENWVKLVN
jgi:hypothetical protein